MPAAPVSPPLHFALLAASVRPSDPPSSLYRGSLPKPHNLTFLSTLHLRTIVSVTPKPIAEYEAEAAVLLETKDLALGGGGARRRRTRTNGAEGVSAWATREGVRVIHVRVGAGKAKDGHIPFDAATVKVVLELMVARENLPMYVHDLDGSDVVSIMGAALRKLQGWAPSSYAAEMSRFLRAPPPATEHLTFLSRLFSPTPHASDDGALSLSIPAPALRAPWLWPTGVPTPPPTNSKKGPNGGTTSSNNAPSSNTGGGGERDGGASHGTMRCRIARDPVLDGGGGLGSSAAEEGDTDSTTAYGGGERADGRPEMVRGESDGQRTLRSESLARGGAFDARGRTASALGRREGDGDDWAGEREGSLGGYEDDDDGGEGEDGDSDSDEEGYGDDFVPESLALDALDLA